MKSLLHRLEKQITQLLWVSGVVFLFSGLACAGFAQEGKGKEIPKKADKENITATYSVAKEIEGEVSAVNTRGIAVVFERDLKKGTESEIFIPLEKEKIRMVHKSKIEDIQVGDTVKVEYEIITEETKEGESSRFNAKTITFLKPVAKKPLPQEPPTTEDDAEETALPLKGVR